MQTWPSPFVERSSHHAHGRDTMVERTAAAAVEFKKPRRLDEVASVQCLGVISIGFQQTFQQTFQQSFHSTVGHPVVLAKLH